MAFALKADFRCDIVIMRQEMSSREAAHLLAFFFCKRITVNQRRLCLIEGLDRRLFLCSKIQKKVRKQNGF